MHYKLAIINAERLPTGKLPRSMSSEIAEIILNAKMSEGWEGLRTDLSRQFRELFNERGWTLDTNLMFEPARTITMHYRKNDVEVQVSWRHYEKIGTEMLKFQTDFVEGRIVGGIFICISEELREETVGAFSGSITMDKAIGYLKSVESVIQVPIAIFGLLPN
jgi:hypothetical protein